MYMYFAIFPKSIFARVGLGGGGKGLNESFGTDRHETRGCGKIVCVDHGRPCPHISLGVQYGGDGDADEAWVCIVAVDRQTQGLSGSL